jgi:hypothetical protein
LRRLFALIPMILLLASCGTQTKEGEMLALDVRTRALEATSCQMEAEVLSDYGDRIYAYTLSFQWNETGESRITVEAPEIIRGVTAVIEEGETKLMYEGAELETGPLSPNGLSPMDALPALLTACREGYISRVDLEKWGDTPAVRVAYGEGDGNVVDAVQYRIWYEAETKQPLYGEILSGGKAVIRCTFQSVAWVP